MPNWTLQPVARVAIAEVVAFVDNARRELFPMLAKAPLPHDLAHFADTYLDGAGCFLETRDAGRLVAVDSGAISVSGARHQPSPRAAASTKPVEEGR